MKGCWVGGGCVLHTEHHCKTLLVDSGHSPPSVGAAMSSWPRDGSQTLRHGFQWVPPFGDALQGREGAGCPGPEQGKLSVCRASYRGDHPAGGAMPIAGGWRGGGGMPAQRPYFQMSGEKSEGNAAAPRAGQRCGPIPWEGGHPGRAREGQGTQEALSLCAAGTGRGPRWETFVHVSEVLLCLLPLSSDSGMGSLFPAKAIWVLITSFSGHTQ